MLFSVIDSTIIQDSKDIENSILPTNLTLLTFIDHSTGLQNTHSNACGHI